MKIHYVAPHFFPDIGGVEEHLTRLASYMVGKGHEVTVHTSRVSTSGRIMPPQEDLEGILIRRYTPRLRLGYYATLFRPVIGEADLLHTHGYAFLPNDLSVRRYSGRMGTVMTMHHGVRMTPPSFRGRLLKRMYDIYGTGTLKRADRVLTSSEADREWLVERRLTPGKIDVVPDGVDEEAFQPGDASLASRRGL